MRLVFSRNKKKASAVRVSGSKEERKSRKFTKNPLLGILGFKCGRD